MPPPPTADELVNMVLEEEQGGEAPPGGATRDPPAGGGAPPGGGGVTAPPLQGPISTGGFVDLMNGDAIPNVSTPGTPGFFFNIDDPNYADKWAGPDPIQLTLKPVQPDMTNPCMSNCEALAKKREANCSAFRLRVAQAMATAGCPSIITPIPERRPCGGMSTPVYQVQTQTQTTPCATCQQPSAPPSGGGCGPTGVSSLF